MFNVKDTRATSLTSFSCLYCLLWTYFTPFSSISIVEFDQVNVCCAGTRHFSGAFLVAFAQMLLVGKFFLQGSVGKKLGKSWEKRKAYYVLTQSVYTCSKLTVETLEQGVKYVQSQL